MKPRKSTHAATLSSILALCNRPGICLFRNNTGAVFPTGKDGKTRCVRYGLAKGSADIIGWKRVWVWDNLGNQSMTAQFAAIEVKDEKDRIPMNPRSASGLKKLAHWQEQQRFLDKVTTDGGLAGRAWTVEDAFRILGLEVLK